MLTRLNSARRRERLPVSAQVSTMEPRTLLSGNAIHPLPAGASATPSAAAPADFSGDWDFAVPDATNFKGLHLNQTGATVSGTYDFDSDGTIYSLPLAGTVKGKKMTLESTENFSFVLKVKLQSQDSFKGKIKLANNPKTTAQGSRISGT